MDTFVDCCTYPLARGSKCSSWCWGTVALHRPACLPSLGKSFLYCCSRFGLSQHSSVRGMRLSVESTVCAASRIASVNPLAASGAVVFGWPVCSPRLCRNLSTTYHRDISTCNSCRLNCRCFGLARMARLWAIRPPRSTVAITMLWSESALAGSVGWGCTTHVAYSTSMCLTREYVVDAFAVARAAPCDTVVCVRNSAFTRTEEGVHDG